MGYRNLRQCVTDLEQAGHLIRLDHEIDAHLEAAEIQRRLYEAGGPAVLFTRVKNCRFPMVCNLFGTKERTHFLFRDTLDKVRRLVELKIDPTAVLKRPLRYAGARAGRSWNVKRRSISCRRSRAGRTTAARSSRCPRSIRKTSTNRA
jgi:4-hydroxy-3-polyprenylbenzoate decarboxylase